MPSPYCFRDSSLSLGPASLRSWLGLGDLPTEILLVILDYSGEASLIHTCKKLWQTLPNFVRYTRRLVLAALIPFGEFHERHPISRIASDLDLLSLDAPITSDDQQHIRRQVFWSFWFKDHHLRQAHQALLRWRVHQAYHRHSGRRLPRSQQRKLDVYVKRLYQRHLMSTIDIVWRNSKLGLTVNAFAVTVHEQNGPHRSSNAILDFGNVAPNWLLSPPVTLTKILLLREVSLPPDTIPVPPDVYSSTRFLRCTFTNSVPHNQRKGADFLTLAETIPNDRAGELVLSEYAKQQPWLRGLAIVTDGMLRQTGWRPDMTWNSYRCLGS